MGKGFHPARGFSHRNCRVSAASFMTNLSSIYRRWRASRLRPIGQRCAVYLGNSNDQDSGVVLKLAAAEIGDAVQQATVKGLRRQLTVAERGLGQALFAKLLTVAVHRLAQAICKHH